VTVSSEKNKHYNDYIKFLGTRKSLIKSGMNVCFKKIYKRMYRICKKYKEVKILYNTSDFFFPN